MVRDKDGTFFLGTAMRSMESESMRESGRQGGADEGKGFSIDDEKDGRRGRGGRRRS